ncbi:MAG TPA: hypothetical protein PLR83_01400 [Pyrinomonadaceae bacterium]|nr:hypothetical protein [Pyrinomonadaceae bacterium]
MKRQLTLLCSLFAMMLTLSIVASAQVNRPFQNGSVWVIGVIQIKPGMQNAYKSYIATEWKKQQEALKKDGQILSYMVIETEAHSVADWNMLLMTEYKDLATYEANQTKADELNQTLVGNDAKQMQGYRDRLQIREVVGNRLSRQIILEPKR